MKWLHKIRNQHPCSSFYYYLANGYLYENISFREILTQPHISRSDKVWFLYYCLPHFYRDTNFDNQFIAMVEDLMDQGAQWREEQNE